MISRFPYNQSLPGPPSTAHPGRIEHPLLTQTHDAPAASYLLQVTRPWLFFSRIKVARTVPADRRLSRTTLLFLLLCVEEQKTPALFQHYCVNLSEKPSNWRHWLFYFLFLLRRTGWKLFFFWTLAKFFFFFLIRLMKGILWREQLTFQWRVPFSWGKEFQ